VAITFELLSPDKFLPPDYWLRQLPGVTSVELEIGPGEGRYLVEAAKQHPTTLFVGFEIRRFAAQRLAANAKLPANVRVFHADGRWIVEHLLAPATIDAVHVYFPDPWWKKRHLKRRLFTPGFVEGLRRCLKPGGRIYMITDVERIFVDTSDKLEAAGFTRHSWQRPETGAGQSSYERKYRRQQRQLFEAYFEKKA